MLYRAIVGRLLVRFVPSIFTRRGTLRPVGARYPVRTPPRLLAFGVLSLAWALPAAVSALVIPLGPEFQVNTYTTEDQYGTARSVSRSPDGSFVVVWMSYGSSGTDTSDTSIHAQRYDSTGAAAGTQFQVNTYTTGRQEEAAVAAGFDGSFVVVWDSPGSSGTDTSGYSVQAQRYDAAGAAAGTQFQINTYTTGSQGAPAVAPGSDGGFVVIWGSRYSSGDTFESIQAQRYDSTGATTGTQFRVNTYTTGDQYRPAVAAGVDGSFVVVWINSSSGYDIQAQRYDSTGVAAGTQFQVSTHPPAVDWTPTVAIGSDGGFVVVWSGYGAGTDTHGYSVQAQRYDATGAAAGTQFQVNTYTTDAQYMPSVAADSDGGFVVVWMSLGSSGTDSSLHSESVQAQRYDSTGIADGTEFQVNTYTTGGQFRPAVAAGSKGDFVVVWNGAGDDSSSAYSYGIFGQRFAVCTDGDFDGSCDSSDNCPIDANPLQLDTDNDGQGDVCDPCPARSDNVCDPDGSATGLVGSEGGTLSTPNGLIDVMLPPGAVGQETPISVTDNTNQFKIGNNLGTKTAFKVALRPEGQTFAKPVTITFAWNDADDGDDKVDLGTCADGITACSNDAGCTVQGAPTPCSPGASLRETRLVLKKDGVTFSTLRCPDVAHQPGGVCETASAGDAAGNCVDPTAVVAKCCDEVANIWVFETCSFSELMLGEMEADLIPGKGSPKKDCIAEFAVNNPQNDPIVDKKEFPNFAQTCTDGDALCDADGVADGKCTFEIGVCLNVEDERLLKKGEVQCTPSDVQIVELKKPRPDSSKPVDAANALALQGVFASLGAHTIGGKHGEILTYTPIQTGLEVCTPLAPFEVLLKGKNQGKKGKANLKIRLTPSVPTGKSRGDRDSDKLKLTCLPPQ